MQHAEALKHLRQFERADLRVLLGVIDGAAATLKLDAHGDWIVSGGLLGHAVGLRQRRPGAADHLARFRFAAPVAGRSGRSEWPAAPAGRPLASDPGECTGSGFLARRAASHDRGDGP
jgi:hypothetical protein